MADLVTLAAVKSYLAITSNGQDALISSLIPRESRLIEAYTSVSFPAKVTAAKWLHGTGSGILVLPEVPILSIEQLQIGGVDVPLSTDGVQAGYTFSDTAIYLTAGARFPYGRNTVLCGWTAGYRESETDFVPASTPFTITPTTSGAAAVDKGVVNAATGAALTLVGSSPAAGQYSFSAGVYTFAAADAGMHVTMSYWYVPGPVAQACIEMIGLDLKQRDNLGINSKSLAGETISYSDKGMSSSVKEMLQPFRRMFPA